MAVFWLVLQTWRPFGPLNGGVLADSTNMTALLASDLNGGVLAGSTNMAALRASEWWRFG